VTLIEQDNLGRIWVGLDADLWRYDPPSALWQRFAPPQAPEGYRFGFITDLPVDPGGEPWPMFALCGGASCFGASARYRLHGGEWVQIGEATSEPQSLAFDGAGSVWLFAARRVYRLEGDQPLERSAAELAAEAVIADTTGQVWVVGAQPGGETALWLLASTPVEKSPTQPGTQRPSFALKEDQDIIEAVEPQIRDFLNAGGNVEAL
jgi:hypothetical protein